MVIVIGEPVRTQPITNARNVISRADSIASVSFTFLSFVIGCVLLFSVYVLKNSDFQIYENVISQKVVSQVFPRNRYRHVVVRNVCWLILSTYLKQGYFGFSELLLYLAEVICDYAKSRHYYRLPWSSWDTFVSLVYSQKRVYFDWRICYKLYQYENVSKYRTKIVYVVCWWAISYTFTTT